MSLSMASQCGSLTPRSRRRRGSLLDAGCSQRAASKHNRGKLNGREEMRFTHTTECERKPIQEYEIEYPAPRLRVSHSSRGASPPAETPVASLLPPPPLSRKERKLTLLLMISIGYHEEEDAVNIRAPPGHATGFDALSEMLNLGVL